MWVIEFVISKIERPNNAYHLTLNANAYAIRTPFLYLHAHLFENQSSSGLGCFISHILGETGKPM